MNPLDFNKFEENLRQMRQALGAASRYARSGFKNVSNEILQKRREICLACDFWDQNGWLGAGKCNKCGCSSAKLMIATEECPIGRWGKEIDTP